MSSTRLVLLPALLALALIGAPGCGDDDNDDASTSIPEITVPEGVPQTTTEEQTTPPQETTTDQGGSGGTGVPGGSGGSGGSGGTNFDPDKPDSPTNDVPPEPNTPESKFEEYCRTHPGACG